MSDSELFADRMLSLGLARRSEAAAIAASGRCALAREAQ